MNNANSLWYTQPARQWIEGLPIGNGRLGCMVLGQPAHEQLSLNQDSVWYGGPKTAENPDAPACLPQIRELLFAGKVHEAQKLLRMGMMSTPKYFNPYQPLGKLQLWFTGCDEGTVEDYTRRLDLETGSVAVSFKAGGHTHTRHFFASYPANALVMRFETDAPRGLSFSACLTRRPFDGDSGKNGPDSIFMRGELGANGSRYHCVAQAKATGGCLTTMGDFLYIENAQSVLLVLTATTTFYDTHPGLACQRQARDAIQMGYDALFEAHLKDYQPLYSSVELVLGEDGPSRLPTDARLRAYQSGQADLGLESLYFQYGRYLTIASSRPGSLPSNLQGIWNDEFTPAWESKYTININTQMNYWPVEVCGLPECHTPLLDIIHRMRKNGQLTAKRLYGCEGFVAHHNTNIWAETRPEGILVDCVVWPMGGAWLCLHLYEHFLFTQDMDFLVEKAYPVMKAAAAFFIDYLVETPEGYLVSGPSVSPENSYILPDGTQGTVCMGPTMDTEIIRELFTACIEAAQRLEMAGDSFTASLANAMKRLPPLRIGKHGQIMEWLEDYDEKEIGHRHISHLFALHPGTQILPEKEPALAKAAQATLARRLENGGGHTGWSCAWIINMYARLYDAAAAYQNLQVLLRKSTYANLLDKHPPFQIDGNFGGTAAVAEMLMQSHGDAITLLPALPGAWPNGRVAGLRARGGFVLGFSWANGALQSVDILAKATGNARIRFKDKRLCQPMEAGQHYCFDGDLHLYHQK